MEVFVDLSSNIGGLANVLSSIRNLKKWKTETSMLSIPVSVSAAAFSGNFVDEKWCRPERNQIENAKFQEGRRNLYLFYV